MIYICNPYIVAKPVKVEAQNWDEAHEKATDILCEMYADDPNIDRYSFSLQLEFKAGWPEKFDTSPTYSFDNSKRKETIDRWKIAEIAPNGKLAHAESLGMRKAHQ